MGKYAQTKSEFHGITSSSVSEAAAAPTHPAAASAWLGGLFAPVAVASGTSAAAASRAAVPMSAADITTMLTVVYSEFNREKLADVPRLAAKYAGSGALLLAGLKEKYGAAAVERALSDAAATSSVPSKASVAGVAGDAANPF